MNCNNCWILINKNKRKIWNFRIFNWWGHNFIWQIARKILVKKIPKQTRIIKIIKGTRIDILFSLIKFDLHEYQFESLIYILSQGFARKLVPEFSQTLDLEKVLVSLKYLNQDKSWSQAKWWSCRSRSSARLLVFILEIKTCYRSQSNIIYNQDMSWSWSWRRLLV